MFVFGDTDFDVCIHCKGVSLQQLGCSVTLISGLQCTYCNGRRCSAPLCWVFHYIYNSVQECFATHYPCFVTRIIVHTYVSLHPVGVSLHLLQCPGVFHYTAGVSLHLLQGTLELHYTITVFGCTYFSVYMGVSIHYHNVSFPLISGHVTVATRFSVMKHWHRQTLSINELFMSVYCNT